MLDVATLGQLETKADEPQPPKPPAKQGVQSLMQNDEILLIEPKKNDSLS